MRRYRSRSYWLRAAVVIVGVSVVTLLLEKLGWLERFETTGLDAFNILQPTRDPGDVVMIGISDAEYKKRFEARSPLACDGVKQIVAAIAAGGPRVIGVDLDTSSGDFSCLDGLPSERPPIVWAQDTVGDMPKALFQPLPVLHGATLRTTDRAGIIQFPLDSDGVIRRYARRLPTSEGEADSFPWVVAKTFCTRAHCADCCSESQASSDTLRLNFAGERFSFPPLSVDHVVAGAATEGWANGPLKDRIVLLGGDYREARDRHATPIGERTGLQILAQAIETEVQHGGIRTVNWTIAFVLDLVAGFVLVGVHLRFERRPALTLVASLMLMPVLALASSLIAFSTLSLWFNFVPVIVSVLIHQLYEHAKEYAELKTSP
jgi:CHASE2 domain-containing sensor protein